MLLLSKFKISGHSMEPLFLHGDKILTTNIFYLFKSPQINDIVVFKDITNVFVKRITKIINDKYFVSGDNQNDSLDSKDFGAISKSQILGKFIYKL
ncbi:MAG: S26 family signal peptidase [Patescibacteria group bacterium]